MIPLAVLVTFVRRDDDGGAGFFQRAQGFQNVRRAHDVRGVGFQRMLVGIADERLGGEVKDKIRLDAEKGFFHRGSIAHVADFVFDFLREAELFKDRGRGRWRLGEAVDAGAKLDEPARQPRALEPGVAREPDGLALKCVGKHHQIFQGALPSAQSLLRYWDS